MAAVNKKGREFTITLEGQRSYQVCISSFTRFNSSDYRCEYIIFKFIGPIKNICGVGVRKRFTINYYFYSVCACY